MEAFVIPKNVRVRAAPSPTGFLHIGTARTVLFNYLFAKRYGGEFLLRIEDTDEERSRREFEEDIVSSLSWLHLRWNEALVRQSERTDIHTKYLSELFARDKAYYCFCTKEELEQYRDYMRANGFALKYSGRCAGLSKKESEKKRHAGAPSVIRFRAEGKRLSFNDLIKGHIEMDTGLIGDFTIAKSLEEPLYNFAAAVDDGDMRITHVIRGEDHISNTPKQILIQEALGFQSPLFAHLPIVLGSDKSKLSKRHGAASIKEYREEGYLPEAVLNFIAFLGWNPKREQEIFSLAELEKEFDIHNANTSNAVFNVKKLEWFNAHYIRQKTPDELARLCAPFVSSADPNLLLRVVILEKERMKKLSDIKELAGFFFSSPEYASELLIWKKSDKESIRKTISSTESILAEIPVSEFKAQRIKEALAPIASQFGNGEVYWPLRVALSGKEFSPGPPEIAEALGKHETLKRVEKAITLLRA